MLKIQEIRELIKLIDQSSIEEFNFEQNGAKVMLKKQASRESLPQATDSETVNTGPVSVRTEEKPAPSEKKAAEKTTEPADSKKSEQKSEPTRDENLHTIKSPMVGTFYESPSPESSAYVKKGDKVSDDSVVCIVEAMKLMNEIEAEIKGEIVEILVENGQLVEYGQELFLVKPE